MPGIGEEIDGAVQQAPQPGRQRTASRLVVMMSRVWRRASAYYGSAFREISRQTPCKGAAHFRHSLRIPQFRYWNSSPPSSILKQARQLVRDRLDCDDAIPFGLFVLVELARRCAALESQERALVAERKMFVW